MKINSKMKKIILLITAWIFIFIAIISFLFLMFEIALCFFKNDSFNFISLYSFVGSIITIIICVICLILMTILKFKTRNIELKHKTEIKNKESNSYLKSSFQQRLDNAKELRNL